MIWKAIPQIVSALFPIIALLVAVAVLALTGLLVPLILFFATMAGIWILHKAGALDLDRHPWVIALPFLAMLAFYALSRAPLMVVVP